MQPSFKSAFQTSAGLASQAWHDVSGFIVRTARSAGAYDEAVLKEHGTARDFRRRDRLGTTVIIAALIAGLGWGYKIYTGTEGISGAALACIIAFLAAMMVHTIESFMAGEVDPFASAYKKFGMCTLRMLFAALSALFAAIPWISAFHQAETNVELAKIGLEKTQSLRADAVEAFGMPQLVTTEADLKADARTAAENLQVLPGSIVDQQQLAKTCDVDLDKLISTNKRKAEIAMARLPDLSAIEKDPSVTRKQLEIVARERKRIRTEVERMLEAVDLKKTTCQREHALFEEARTRYLAEWTTKRDGANRRLAAHIEHKSRMDDRLKAENQRTDALVVASVRRNTGYEFDALLRVIVGSLYAKLFSVAVFIGLFIIDALPMMLRLLVAPGPYDAHLRTIEATRHMEAQTRFLEAKFAHDIRRAELLDSDDIKHSLKGDVRSSVTENVKAYFGNSPEFAK